MDFKYTLLLARRKAMLLEQVFTVSPPNSYSGGPVPLYIVKDGLGVVVKEVDILNNYMGTECEFVGSTPYTVEIQPGGELTTQGLENFVGDGGDTYNVVRFDNANVGYDTVLSSTGDISLFRFDKSSSWGHFRIGQH